MEIEVKTVNQKKADELKTLIKNTDKENPKAEHLRLLQKELSTNAELYRTVGNISNQVFQGILAQATARSAFFKECAEKYIEEMKAELGYHSSTFVEKMLIDEISMRWLRLQVMENDHKNATYREHRFAEGIYQDKRLHLAQKRFLRSIETLVKVRKMIAAAQAKGAEMFKNLMANESKSDSKT